MPRVGEPILRGASYPWDEWEKALKKSPTRTLYFGPDDFDINPKNFVLKVRKAFKHLDVFVAMRGEEVMVMLNA